MKLKNRSQMHWLRKAWHFVPGFLFAISCQSIGLTDSTFLTILITLCLSSFIFEYLRANNKEINARCQKYFKYIMREDEKHKMSGIPSYLASMAILFWLCPRDVAAVSILFLAVGDPIASVGGLLSTRLGFGWRVNSKNVLGSVCFVVFCLLAAYLYSRYYLIDIKWSAMVVAAIIGSVVELLNPTRVINDNLSIPLIVAIVISIFN